LGVGVGLWGNMTVTVSIASPSMVWRSLAIPTTDERAFCVGSPFPTERWSLVGWNEESKKERAQAVVGEVEV
jgi:hypothetical protein